MRNSITSTARLISFIQRLEHLNDEQKAVGDDIRETLAECKSEGFHVGTIKEILRLRKMSQDEREEHEALLDIYKAALGMLDGTPLGSAAINRLQNPPKPPPKPGAEGEPVAETPTPEPGEANSLAKPVPGQASVLPEEIEDARFAGFNAAKIGTSVIQNPHRAHDPRRAAWDEGWCDGAGSDGMEIPAAWKPTPKAKLAKPKPAPEAPPDDQPGESA